MSQLVANNSQTWYYCSVHLHTRMQCMGTGYYHTLHTYTLYSIKRDTLLWRPNYTTTCYTCLPSYITPCYTCLPSYITPCYTCLHSQELTLGIQADQVTSNPCRSSLNCNICRSSYPKLLGTCNLLLLHHYRHLNHPP